jgi:hypothetical protein
LVKHRWDHFQAKEWSKEQRGKTRKHICISGEDAAAAASLAAFAVEHLKIMRISRHFQWVDGISSPPY